jgi:hypothetical protein
VCAFSARAARDELIKWWINLKKNGGKRSKIRKNINDERKSPRERVKAQTFCCVVCCVHFLGEKRNFLAGRGSVFCVVLFSPSCSCSCSFSRFACTTWSCVCMYTREMLVFSIFIPPRPRTLQFVSGHPFSLA